MIKLIFYKERLFISFASTIAHTAVVLFTAAILAGPVAIVGVISVVGFTEFIDKTLIPSFSAFIRGNN